MEGNEGLKQREIFCCIYRDSISVISFLEKFAFFLKIKKAFPESFDQKQQNVNSVVLIVKDI